MQKKEKDVLDLSGKTILKDMHLHLDAEKNHTESRKIFHI